MDWNIAEVEKMAIGFNVSIALFEFTMAVIYGRNHNWIGMVGAIGFGAGLSVLAIGIRANSFARRSYEQMRDRYLELVAQATAHSQEPRREVGDGA